MDFTRESGLYCKAKSIVSTVYGIMLWASSFPSPMKTTREETFVSPEYYFNLGLTAFTNPEKETPKNTNGHPRILHYHMIISPLSLPLSSSSSSSSSSRSSLFPVTIHTASSLSSWSSSLTGDFIGSESGVYTIPNDDIITKELERSSDRYSKSTHVKRSQKYEKMKEYPLPIPSLARTGNLPSRMPWVLTRHYVDRRLILKMHKVKRHEYFEADRSNGHLVLKLIPVHDIVTCCHDQVDHENIEREEIEEDLNFIEDENNETESEEEEAQTNADVDVDDWEDEVYGLLEKVVDGASQRKKTLTSFACSVPKTCRENGWENGDEYGRLCFTYAAGTLTGFGLHGGFNEEQDGSSPLSLGRFPPVASVV